MGATRLIEKAFKRYLPFPFTIAILLTFLTILLALFLGREKYGANQLFKIFSYWESGIWNNDLLVFAYQMMLILVLGHVLVLSKPMERFILGLTRYAKNTQTAAVLVLVLTMIVAFFNWGLGLIFGAILARKVGEYAQENNIKLNYPLIGACGYSGLMVWHGGISGSAPIKASEAGHLSSLMQFSAENRTFSDLPEVISTSLTVFSSWNLILFLIVLLCNAVLAYWLGKITSPTKYSLNHYQFITVDRNEVSGAEKLDRSRILSFVFAGMVLSVFLLQYLPALRQLNLTPNLLNFFMLGLAILLHGSFKSFLNAVEEAIGDVSGILIQFPLYFGIMGIMNGSGMIGQISNFFVSVSTEVTLPIYTFFSAAVVNIFVPSGGGQWAVQGPLVIESALKLGVPLPKAIMALAYGDQITNMLQPFWALPLLGITKLKANEILPYTLLFMVVGGLIFLLGLLLI